MINFTLQLTSDESTFEYSFPQDKFYYLVNGVEQNNNPFNEEKIINIPNGKYEFNELIMTINRMLKKDKGFFKASLENSKVFIKITKSVYSINFAKYK